MTDGQPQNWAPILDGILGYQGQYQTLYNAMAAASIIGVLPIGLRGDMRLGLALEAAKRGIAYSETNLKGWQNSTSIYLGGETPLGPVYVGYGYSTSGVWNVYLFLGTP